jgi:hypothetical protein
VTVNADIHLPDHLVHVSAPEVTFEATLPAAQAPVVQVIHTQAPDVHVAAPEVHVAAPTVNVAAPAVSVSAAPITVQPAEVREIRIVGLPDRQTSSNVQRDKDGNIIRTTQIETDA